MMAMDQFVDEAVTNSAITQRRTGIFHGACMLAHGGQGLIFNGTLCKTKEGEQLFHADTQLMDGHTLLLF